MSNDKNLRTISRKGPQIPLCKTSNAEKESRLFVTGESVELLPLPSKTTTHLYTKHGHLVNERAMVLELYEEERKRGL